MKEGSSAFEAQLESNIHSFTELLGETDDFVVRRFRIFAEHEAAMMYLANMSNTAVVNEDILKPLMHTPPHLQNRSIPMSQLKDVLLRDVIYFNNVKSVQTIDSALSDLLRGGTLITVDGLTEAILLDTAQIEKRSLRLTGYRAGNPRSSGGLHRTAPDEHLASPLSPADTRFSSTYAVYRTSHPIQSGGLLFKRHRE